MERLYYWNAPDEQSALLNAVQRSSAGFVPFADRTDQTITDRFASVVARHPNHLSIKGPRHSYSYSELDAASNAIAAGVIAATKGCISTVALFLDHDIQVIACILGVLKAGSIYVPLDPSLTGTRNSIIVNDSSATIVLTDSRYYSAAQALFGSDCQILNIDEVARRGSGVSPRAISPEDSACVIYTSGSTGRPRGVLHTHKTVVQMAKRYAHALAVGPNDRVALLYSCSVAASLGNIFGPILAGAALMPFNVREKGFPALAHWLTTEKISVYHSSPSVFRATFESMATEVLLPDVRIVRTGGDMAYKSDFDLFKRRVKSSSTMVNAYGCSEISTVSCFYMTPDSVITDPILPVGCPVDGTEVAILDDDGKVVQPGEVGEIAIRSAYISPGYWSKEAETQVEHNVKNNDVRVYRTGDRGLILSGCLVHQGRKDSQVKIRGYRIELAEVESTLRSHPMVKEAIVVSKKLTEQDKCLVAYVVAKSKSDLTTEALSAFIAAKLPQYMQPAAYVLKEKLPQTEVGKVDRVALANRKPRRKRK
jgi:amino acid adenylation domain-containing protein